MRTRPHLYSPLSFLTSLFHSYTCLLSSHHTHRPPQPAMPPPTTGTPDATAVARAMSGMSALRVMHLEDHISGDQLLISRVGSSDLGRTASRRGSPIPAAPCPGGILIQCVRIKFRKKGIPKPASYPRTARSTSLPPRPPRNPSRASRRQPSRPRRWRPSSPRIQQMQLYRLDLISRRRIHWNKERHSNKGNLLHSPASRLPHTSGIPSRHCNISSTEHIINRL